MSEPRWSSDMRTYYNPGGHYDYNEHNDPALDALTVLLVEPEHSADSCMCGERAPDVAVHFARDGDAGSGIVYLCRRCDPKRADGDGIPGTDYDPLCPVCRRGGCASC